MALQGINMPLAMLGTEWVWTEVFTKDFNLSATELGEFFSGPAFLPWHWMGNLDQWGGPLPAHWIQRGRQLQHQFLRRAREYGMKPVLPAFAGFVPPALQQAFPTASIHRASGWNGMASTHYLAASDPLFSQIGEAFLKRLCAEFGCGERMFSADLYNELIPPSSDTAYLQATTASVYEVLQKVAGEGTIWVVQGWMLHADPSFWQPPQIQAFLNGPPEGGIVMLDLYAEVSPMWKPTQGMYSHPWIFSTIFNFGGRSGLYGRLEQLVRGIDAALEANASIGRSLHGLGAAPEAIETDPIMYDLLFEQVWSSPATSNLTDWVGLWAARRYSSWGETVPAAAVEAWQLLRAGPYACERSQEGPVGSLIAARPAFTPVFGSSPTDLYYDPKLVLRAWELLLTLPGESPLITKTTYVHDVADIGVQALTNLALARHAEAVTAYASKDLTAFRLAGEHFLAIVNDTDTLASTQEGRLLGQWIKSARLCAASGAEDAAVPRLPEANLYEVNAKLLITLWAHTNSTLHEYSYRLWGGLIGSFYYQRWRQWFSAVAAALESGRAFQEAAFESAIQDWEESWVQDLHHEAFPDEPTLRGAQVRAAAAAIFARHFEATPQGEIGGTGIIS
ncbi:unnamed protein product [Polarella glacialis]|uniref:Alpha-N-acetylglucosaminidase n=1 Tax=Polarella glacialis TaxID=89957 RepID=A0A813LPH3_POLGL|nr:unnamed protein product [Polarella glacialis]